MNRLVAVKRSGAALVAFATTATAQSYHDVARLPPVSPGRPLSPLLASAPSSDSTRIAVPVLRAILFVNADDVARGEGVGEETEDEDVMAVELPVLDRAFLRRFEADIGKPLSFARLAEIRHAVIERFRRAGQPLVDVYVPEQDVASGVVRITVAEFRLGKVEARGNRYFSNELLVREMPLASGSAIREADVAAGLAVLNANPYRSVEVVYVPGAFDNTTDVVLQTEDRLPLRVSGGYDNAGVPQLGRDRISAGIGYGNLFGLDQQIAWQFTASNDIFGGTPEIDGRPARPRFVAHSFNYIAPLPWSDQLELFGVYARSTPRLAGSFNQTGISTQMSVRYDRRLPSLTEWQHQIQFGYDFKRSNNDLEFGGTQVFNANTHIHQFVIAYDVTSSDATGQMHANVALIASPGHLDGDNDGEAFNAARLGASPRYMYLQLAGQRDWSIGAGWSVSAHALVQWTSSTLLPSEEIGLGGDASLRGYAAYAAQGDRGWNLQSEVRSPLLSFGASGIALQPFLFLDAGHVWNRVDQPAEMGGSGALASVGAGLRLQVSRFVNARVTYGQPLKAAVPGGSKEPLAQIFVVMGS
ncbi:MAG TPA: ShlB/FhaC/HecB family hemolysin secretion/activation protein [Trinickia sp.]|nr:ShlB/FhaC/HecB family hemolysin secretion/activation protein [Trinickia sp.]